MRFATVFALLLTLAATHAGAADLAQALKLVESGSHQEALATLRPLAELGNPTAQRVLGESLLNGNGVPKDETAGAGWLLAARDNGSAESAAAVESVTSRMGPEQLTQARTYVERFGKAATASLDPADGAHVAPVLKLEPRRGMRIDSHLTGRMIKAARIYGWSQASFSYIVDETGQVRDIHVSDLLPNGALGPTMVEYHRFHKFRPAMVEGRAVPAASGDGFRLKLLISHPPFDDAARSLMGPAAAGDTVAQCSLSLILPAVEKAAEFSNLNSYDLIRAAAASGTDGRALYFYANAKAKADRGRTKPFTSDYLVGEPRAMLLKSARAGFAPAQLAVALNAWAERQPEGYVRARRWLTAARGRPEADKYLAALLLSHPTDAQADAALARELATAVTETGYGRQDPDALQILAAAHAAGGDFKAAIRVQKEAARWAKMYRWSPEEFDRRMAEYRASRAVRDEIVTIPTVARQVDGETLLEE